MDLTPCFIPGCIILIVALWLPFAYGQLEGYADARKIRRNGTKDTLKEVWHKQNLIRRAVVCTTGVLVIGALLNWLLGFGLGFFAAYGFYAACLFGRTFTTVLNCKRNLPRWYVSHDPRASETDKFLIRGSAALGLQPQSFNRLIFNGFLILSAAGLVLVISLKMLINN